MPRPSRLDLLLAVVSKSGGAAGRAELVGATSEGTLRAAVGAGLVVRVRHGVYALADLAATDAAFAPSRAWSRWSDGPTEAERRALVARHIRAAAMKGVLSHRCAAAHHDWPILVEPDLVEILVPEARRSETRGGGLRVRRGRLTVDELRDGVTTPLRTVLDCARDLPFAEALAVADSALRSGLVGPGELVEAASRSQGWGARQIREVARAASPLAANPFESALRAVVRDVPGLHVTPQVEVSDDGFHAQVDLADEAARIVIEADSYEFHGSKERFAADRHRYAELVVRGWLVLPFGFADVTTDPGWVRSMTTAAVISRSR